MSKIFHRLVFRVFYTNHLGIDTQAIVMADTHAEAVAIVTTFGKYGCDSVADIQDVVLDC